MRFLAFLLLFTGSHAFVSLNTPSVVSKTTTTTSTSTSLFYAMGQEEARTAFFVWFFGASGAAGIARGAFPRMYQQTKTILDLKDAQPMGRGETIGLSPLAGYPRDLYLDDVQAIVNDKRTVAQMVKQFPVEGNFLSKNGYLTFDAWAQVHAKRNPLTVRAIFDTFAQSTNVVNPEIAQQKLDQYRTDPNSVNGALVKSKLTSFSAIFVLLFLLGFADVQAADHAYHGWFPTWPGATNFPWSLSDSGLGEIPKYWE